jgi:transposase-like protein
MAISFARHQFAPAIIRYAAWHYVRLTLSYRDEDLLAVRGVDVSYEMLRRWILKFAPFVCPRTSPSTSMANAAVMEWMPPPDGTAMCQGGDVCRIPRNGEGIHERS